MRTDMGSGFVHEATLTLNDLECRLERMSRQAGNLKQYNGWTLRRIRTSKSGDSFYSAKRPGASQKVYLGNGKHPDVVNVKRLRYAKESVKILQSNIRLLKLLIDRYVDTDYASINKRLPATYRTELTHSSVNSYRANLPIEALRWIEKMEKEKAKYPPYKPEQLKHPALDGTMMRSKSEVIIANILLLAGIPFVYEVPVFINGNMVLPDFRILSLIDLKTEILIEHQGMIFDDDYADKFIRSLKLYLSSDWIPNKNLFFTFDDAKERINTDQVTDILRTHIFSDL